MAGWKEWAIGEVVEAGDIQGFIQNQTVMVFDTDTARDTALSGVVIEGMMAYTKDSDLVKVYDGAAWIGLAEAPDLTTLIPKSTVTTAGDLIVADGASSVTRLGVGADGSLVTVAAGSPAYLTPGADDQVLTLASGAPTWADAAGGGGMTLLSSGSLASNTTNISSIPGTYKSLVLHLKDVSYNGADEIAIIRVNGQTGNNYSFTRINNGNVQFTLANNYFRLTDNIPASQKAQIVLEFPNYTHTDGSHIVQGQAAYRNSSSQPILTMFGGNFYQASAITAINIITDQPYQSYDSGTYILYGVN
jgi:hypothetical protein